MLRIAIFVEEALDRGFEKMIQGGEKKKNGSFVGAAKRSAWFVIINFTNGTNQITEVNKMTTLTQLIHGLLNREEGQTLSEYGVILFFLVIVAIAAVALLGGNITAIFNTVANAMTGP